MDTEAENEVTVGWRAQYKDTGKIVVLASRKADDSGWWLADNRGGLSDDAIDGEHWRLLPPLDDETSEHEVTLTIRWQGDVDGGCKVISNAADALMERLLAYHTVTDPGISATFPHPVDEC
jgi:hypothetical protein